MKVSFNTFSNNIYYKNCRVGKEKTQPSSSPANNTYAIPNKIYFMGQLLQPENIAQTNIKKINNEEEYDEILEELKNDRTWYSGWSHGRATKFEQGILPYAGEEDRSVVFNTYMRNGCIVDPRFSPQIIEKYIKVLDYALNEIDKVYGKYNGIVYRMGYVDNPPKNYISTARKPEGLTAVINSRDCYHNPFYIIYTNHGHKIEDIQKKLRCNSQYIWESEILLNPNTHFEQITAITPEMEELKRNLRKSLYDDYGHVPELNTTFYKEI